jgi:hypothetical protein
MSAEKYVLRLLTSALEHEVAVPDREAESFVDKCVGPTVVAEAGAEETGLVQRARTLDEDVARSGPRTATVVIATAGEYVR